MTALTRCPIDGSRIYRNTDGEVTCSSALIGSHSAAVMLAAYTASIGVKAAPRAKGLGEPCKTCGTPRAAVAKSGRAYCVPCHTKGGKSENMPTFSLVGPPPDPYYFDNGRMTR